MRRFGLSASAVSTGAGAITGTSAKTVTTVKNANEVRGLNCKQRSKMAVIKEGQEVHEVIIQEGVYTFKRLNGVVARLALLAAALELEGCLRRGAGAHFYMAIQL